MAAAGWRGAWRSRVSSSTSTEQQDPLQVYLSYCHTNQSHNYNHCGMSIATSGSGNATASLSTTAYTTSSSASYQPAAAGHVSGHSSLLPPLAAAAPPVVETEASEVSQGQGVTVQDKAREHIRDLIHESRGGDSGSGSATATDKWLSELRVSWVLHLAELEAASAGRTFISRRLQHTAHSWTVAVRLIGRSVVCFTGWCSSQEEEGVWPTASEFVGFVATIFLQMLPFVDVVVALDTTNPSSDHSTAVSGTGSAAASARKFQTLTGVREALSGASEQVLLWHLWLRSSPDGAEATRISGETSSLLLAKLDKLDEAIRETRDSILAQSMSLTKEEDSWEISSGLQSPDIHNVTRSVTSYIIVLSTSYDRPALVDPRPPTAHEASLHGKDDVPGDENNASSIHIIMLMMRSLEKKLTRVSQTFQDQSLRFLFLINNFYFVWHQLRTNRLLDAPMQALTRQIDGYINSYLQAAWAPVLKPLHNHALCCFTVYSTKHKFESRFEKTYAAQKLWKVPDPKLREELRTAIANKIISAFTSFLEKPGCGTSASSKLTPEKLEEMLKELFEG
ncbi:unnamed protein product [Urochloa decumbens]|uniref:Exocyst subunit Exo70 family protein n=1 Tax=Urochloa decumbens TaxID=240449 RepID=A0ABC8ZXW1_9POAL